MSNNNFVNKVTPFESYIPSLINNIRSELSEIFINSKSEYEISTEELFNMLSKDIQAANSAYLEAYGLAKIQDMKAKRSECIKHIQDATALLFTLSQRHPELNSNGSFEELKAKVNEIRQNNKDNSPIKSPLYGPNTGGPEGHEGK